MAERYRYVHLHGFASSARSRKGLFLARALRSRDVRLELPDLNRPSFSRLTYTAALGALDELEDGRSAPRRWRLSGSSMGGYLAACWAELHPDRVERLVLLCPAFRPGTSWPRIVGAAALARWERDGELSLPDGAGRIVPVHWELVCDQRRHPPWPEVPCPTLILHGRRDEVVPLEMSEEYAVARRDRVRLVVLEDDHPLGGSLERIGEEVLRFYGLSGR